MITTMTAIIIIIIIIIITCPILAKEQHIKNMIECVHNYSSAYARKQRYNWTKKTLV